MSLRSMSPLLVVLAIGLPVTARGLEIAPRGGVSMVFEDGPPGTDTTAHGTAYSLGLVVGSPLPLLYIVGDLGFRQASVSGSSLTAGWTRYETADTLFTLGVRSQLTLLDRIRAAAELHAGMSWADHDAAASEPVFRYGEPDRYGVFGGAAEASLLFGSRFSLGARLGLDRFVAAGAKGNRGDHVFATNFERTSYTAGLLLGIGL